MSDQVKWTDEQQLAINEKGNNILVAAAAGSGKTAVLVERIIQKIIKDKVDIDKLLVVTFTNAAASEMRERVLKSIYDELDIDSNNDVMKRQILLLGKANICTIHSFCLDVIRNYFYEIDLPVNFKIATTQEVEILKQEVLDEVLEKLYEEEDTGFMKLVDNYATYKNDDKIRDLVFKVYNFIQSSPFPIDWLNEKIEYFKKQEEGEDFAKSIYGKILVDDLKSKVHDAIVNLRYIQNSLEKETELIKTKESISSDIDVLNSFYNSLEKSWDEAYSKKGAKFSLPRWNSDKGFDLAQEIKDKRDKIKKRIEDEINSSINYSSDAAFQNNYAMYDLLVCLKDLIIRFDEEYKKEKKERNILEFSDIEHYALKILVKKDENGNYIPTDVAKSYQEKFEEIAIDEYQDSNQVQEYILNIISKGNNIFMVGDVKQSIYRFRQACPELFIKKYNDYLNITHMAEQDINSNAEKQGYTIQLFKNFRSRENILDFANIIFDNLMGEKFGELNYTKEEYLNYGLTDYPQDDNSYSNKDLAKTEFVLVEMNNDEQEDIGDNVDEDDALELIEQEEVEAKLVSKKIREILDSNIKIYDRKVGLRKAEYKDIVILLRTTSNVAPTFEKVLGQNNIPVYCDVNNEYLDTYEIQTIISILKIIDNPLDDISLVTALRSQIGSFNDNELLEIRLCDRNGYFYDALIKAEEELQGELQTKVKLFNNLINNWRDKSKFISFAELVWDIFTVTGFYNYVSLMPNGTIRKNNLKKLFEMAKAYELANFKGLYGFINYIEKVKSGSSDLSPAKLIGENENVVRIMSIHKSKGLEFPIVFLSNTNRNFNEQDLKQEILLNQTYGLGPEYIDNHLKVQYSTSSKDAIKIINKKESLAEELRVLYVALTRAREKLYITGTKKKIFDDLTNKKELLNVYHRVEEKLNPILLQKCKNYLDWLMYVYESGALEEQSKLTIINKKELYIQDNKEEQEVRQFDFEKNIDIEEIKKELNYDYPDSKLIDLPIKSTVSKIKESYNKEQEELYDINELLDGKSENKIVDIENNLPQFMLENTKLTGSQKGTIIHYIMQKLDLSKEYTESELQIFADDLVKDNSITKEQLEQIDLRKIKTFLDSDIAKELRISKQIYKEKAFVTKYKVDENYILVQGIIDLFYQNQNGEWVLLDYKTDYVPDGNINVLVDKYYKQLEIYKKALEDIIHEKVKHTYIYSLNLGKKVEL